MDYVFTAVFAAVVAAILTLYLVRDFEIADVRTFYQIADCAVQENPELRATAGVATYAVTFVDGKGDTVTCTSRPVE